MNLVGTSIAPDANKFIANLVFELPQQVGLTAGTATNYKINGGLKIGESEIWVSTRNYTVNMTPLAAVEASGMCKYFFCIELVYLQNNTTMLISAAGLLDPYLTAYPTITQRNHPQPFDGNEPFIIPYIIKFQPQTRGDYLFKVGLAGFLISTLPGASTSSEENATILNWATVVGLV